MHVHRETDLHACAAAEGGGHPRLQQQLYRGLYRDRGKENGNSGSIIGIYRDI